MEASNTSPSTSKVIIQCTDPDNLLESFDAKLSTRTPLEKLHWKSPTRPLRSIPSLNISLVRKEPTQNGAQTGARRHQIPGLRETPYLKLYLLRCDDRESYKESARKEIKQWIKENTLEKESKSSLRNQEHHDAYEWMIVHVVVPGTPAASQPKSSKHISLETTDSTDSVNSKSKWTGKSTSTIYDKLRADFSSSKVPIPRVAQVRLTEQGMPPGALPPSEVEEQWNELVLNMKEAILKSFDTRVSQYEEDIRERENQRSLPGWNFCTFFVLKEGLARGFENVGLLDDALVVYSELEIGLDMTVRQSYDQDDVEGAGALLPYSKDLKTVIRKALDEAPDSGPTPNGHMEPFKLKDVLHPTKNTSPLIIDGNAHRELILKNQVSALDLRIYMFTRKMEILLRQAKLTDVSKAGSKSSLDLNVIADFAELALGFINMATREYRSNFYAAWGGRLSGTERATQKVVIGNVVAAWTWSAIIHIVSRLLPALSRENIHTEKSVDSLLKDLLKASTEDEVEKRSVSHDRRSTSSASSSPSRGIRSQSLPRPISISKDSLEVPFQPKKLPLPGLDRVCGWLAQLFLLGRSTLEQLEATQEWTDSLRKFELDGHHQRKKKLNRHSSYGIVYALNGAENESKGEEKFLCLDSTTLRSACQSKESFSDLYRLLSAYACHLFHAAGYQNAFDQVLLELAELAYSSGDKSTAAGYLSKALDSALSSGTAFQRPLAVAMYAQCLEDSDQPNQYAQCLLACLQSSSKHYPPGASQSYFRKLIKVAPLVDPAEVSLGAILMVRDTDKAISHIQDQDGFSISIQLQTMLHASLSASEPMKLYLSAEGQHEPEQVLLEGPNEIELESSSTSVTFAATVNTEGWYKLDRLEITIGNLSFVHHFQQDPAEGISMRQRKYQAPSVMVYPRSDAVSVQMMPSTTIVLGETRTLSLIINGKNDISQIRLRLRAASAGLRLVLHDSTSAETLDITREQDSTVLKMDGMRANTSTAVQIPYTLESSSDPSITVKCEMSYQSNGRTFSLFKSCVVDVILPILVNVQDIHRDSYWFSRFLVRPATLVPIVLWGCNIDDDGQTVVESGEEYEKPLVIFPQQPATWTVRLRDQGHQPNQRLTLNVRYQCLDELILSMLKKRFSLKFEQSPHPQATSLLSSHLVECIKNGWTEQDLEVAGLTQEMDVWRQQDMDWPSVLCAFDKTTKQDLMQMIEEWHSSVSSIPIELDQAPVRLLKLFVDLPSRPPVVNTGLELMTKSNAVAVGQPLVSFLKLEVSASDEMKDLEFSFELFAVSEAWLIGGRKKGNFQASPEGTRLQMILFPQRTGTLLLPMIDVRCRRRDQTKGWIDVPIDVHNRTLSKSLQVTPKLRSTTIDLSSDEATHMRSGAMIDSQDREANSGE